MIWCSCSALECLTSFSFKRGLGSLVTWFSLVVIFWLYEKRCPDGLSWWSNSVACGQKGVESKFCVLCVSLTRVESKKFCALCVSLTREEQEWTDSTAMLQTDNKKYTMSANCRTIYFLDWDVTRRPVFLSNPNHQRDSQKKSGKRIHLDWDVKKSFVFLGWDVKQPFVFFGLRC